MKNTVKLVSILVLVILTTGFILQKETGVPEKKKYISIEDAIKQKVVTAKISGKGGHTGECIEMEIKSLVDHDTLLRIEPGRHLVAQDTVLQDILIIKEIQVLIAAGEKKIMNIFGFCCEATNSSPGKGSKYSVGYMADSSFIKLAMFLSNSNLPLDVMQNAVWVLSNNHTINSISNENENDKPKMKELYKLIASMKGLEIKFPWYTLKYKMDTAVLFTNRPVKLLGEFEYVIADPSHVDLIIRDSQNNPVVVLFSNRPHNPDNYNYRFSLDVSKWPKGKYFAIMFIDNQLRIKREIDL
ncbi:MAG: hypothetical protein U0W24_18060 [Bacteroidales bacterium]